MSLTPEQYLALSSLAYKSITKGVTEGETITIGRMIAEDRIEDYYGKDGSVALELRALSSLSSWTLVNADTSPSGMSAIAVQNPETKEIVFVYRGTDGIERDRNAAIKDYKTDLAIATSGTILEEGLNQFIDAEIFHNATLQKLGADNIGKQSFTGHSLGGGLAQYMAWRTKGQIKTVTFDAVGIAQVLPNVNPRDYDDTVTDYINENDFIGIYGTQLGRTVVVSDGDAASRELIAANNIRLAVMSEALAQFKRGNISLAAVDGMGALLTLAAPNGVLSKLDLTVHPHQPAHLLDANGQLRQTVSNPT